MKENCKNCGAILKTNECSYCGTVYNLEEVKIEPIVKREVKSNSKKHVFPKYLIWIGIIILILVTPFIMYYFFKTQKEENKNRILI